MLLKTVAQEDFKPKAVMFGTSINKCGKVKINRIC